MKLRFLATILRERELILRSHGRVYFLRLTSGLQFCVISFLCGAVLWGVGITIASIVQSGVIGIKNDEIREARVGYEYMFREAETSLAQLEEMISAISKNQMLLADNFKNAGNTKKQKFIRTKIGELEEKGKEIEITRTKLKKSLDDLAFEFGMAEGQRSQIIATRAALRGRVADLKTQLEKSQRLEMSLHKEVASPSTDLSRSRLKLRLRAGQA